jgi:hypothetical protein
MKKVLCKLWRYLRWIFPPYLFWKFVLCPIWWVVTWPFRTIRNLFRGDSEKWATKHLKKMKSNGVRRPYTIGTFRVVWETKQRGTSYISKHTIKYVAETNGLTYRQLVRIMCNPAYEWHFIIVGWNDICTELGFKDHKNHRSSDKYLVDSRVKKDYG